MKKLLALAVAGGLSLTGAVFTAASADPIPVETPWGGASVTAAEEGQILLIDGDADNEEPFGAADGYLGVNGNGLQCSDEGDGYEYTDNNGDGDTADEGEKTATDNGCPAS